MNRVFLAVCGSGKPEQVDAYLYGDNGRALTVGDGGRFATVIVVTTTGGFDAQAQADRLASGLFGATVCATFESAISQLAGWGFGK